MSEPRGGVVGWDTKAPWWASYTVPDVAPRREGVPRTPEEEKILRLRYKLGITDPRVPRVPLPPEPPEAPAPQPDSWIQDPMLHNAIQQAARVGAGATAGGDPQSRGMKPGVDDPSDLWSKIMMLIAPYLMTGGMAASAGGLKVRPR